MVKYFDTGTILVIIITTILFAISLCTHGLTQSILLEAGVLLVSVKLILNGYKVNRSANIILKELNEIKELLNKK